MVSEKVIIGFIVLAILISIASIAVTLSTLNPELVLGFFSSGQDESSGKGSVNLIIGQPSSESAEIKNTSNLLGEMGEGTK